MSIDGLLPDEQARFEKRKRTKLARLKTVKRLSIINRMMCLACVVPFFYTAACLGQKKAIPMISKIGSVGFVACIAGALVLKEKEEKTISDIQRLYDRYRQTKCPVI